MSTATLTDSCHRTVLFAFGAACVAAAVAAGAALLPAGTAAMAGPAIGVALAAISGVVLHSGRRLTQALRAAEQAAAQSRSELQVTLDNMSQGLVLCDTKADVLAVNNRFLQLFGIDARDVWPGMSVPDLIRLQAKAGNMPPEQAEALIHERLSRQPGASGRLEMAFRQGVFQVAYQPRPEGGWCCTFEDITAQKEAQARLAFLAQHDALTGLPNRALLRERIDAAIAAGARFALMIIDLDQFKLVNDTFGHRTGDSLLCRVSERLTARMRERDTAGRLGGDEFAVLMDGPCTRDDAERRVASLVSALTEPFEVEGHRLHVGASIGVTLAEDLAVSETPIDADRLLHQADVALYRTKRDGRHGYRFFEAAPEEAAPATGERRAVHASGGR